MSGLNEQDWYDAGWRRPKEARIWYKAGWQDPEEAYKYYRKGFDPKEALENFKGGNV